MSPLTDPRADVNKDGTVNLFDLVEVGRRFGESIGLAAPAGGVPHITPEQRAILKDLSSKLGTEPNTPDLWLVQSLLHQLLEERPIADPLVVYSNYPNPANPETWLPYQLNKEADVSVQIYDPTGRLVRTLDLGHQSAGSYQNRDVAAYWDGRDSQGQQVASGVYYYTFQANNAMKTGKLMILK